MRIRTHLFTTMVVIAMTSNHCVAQSNSLLPQGRYTGKVIRSFTEPHLKSVVAGAVTGVVVDVTAKEGDRVQVGDPLVKLNRRVLEAQLEIAQARAASTARVDAAASQYQLIKSQLESLEALKEGGHTNRYELELKQAEFQQAFSEYRAAQDDLNLAVLDVKRIEAELEDRTIRSPIGGFITEIHKQPGEQLSNNEPQYATIVSLEKLRVRFYVTADLLKQYRPGAIVVIDVGKNRQSVPGKVSYVSPTIDSDSGVGRLEVLLENKELAIQSGVVAYWNDAATRELARRMHSQQRIAGRAQVRPTPGVRQVGGTYSRSPGSVHGQVRPGYRGGSATQHVSQRVVRSRPDAVGRATLSSRRK